MRSARPLIVRLFRWIPAGGEYLAAALICFAGLAPEAGSAADSVSGPGGIGPSKPPDPGKPFQGKPRSIPGQLECEFYDEGGEGIAYHETDGRNHGSGELNRGGGDLDSFRKDEDVDVSYTKDDWDNSAFNRVPQKLGRLYLGWTAPGEWVRYTVQIERAATYTVGVMYTARYDGSILLECDGQPVGDPIRLEATADARDERRNWHHWNYLERKQAAKLPAGRHILTLKILDRGNLNLDFLRFTPSSTAPPEPLRDKP